VVQVKIEYVKGSNIIGLEPRRMADVFPAVNQVEAYWTALAEEHPEFPVPARARIDPRGIEGALPFAFILERVAPTVGRFRLAGTHLADLMGMEIRGMPLTAMFLPAAREEAGRAFDQALSGPAKVTLTLAGERGVGRAPLDASMVLLPLRDEEGKVTRILGALEARGSLGRTPRRFAIVETRIVTVKPGLVAERVRRPAPNSAGPGVAEPAGPAPSFESRAKPGARPALRVIQGGGSDS
jgi:hypothetical protein